MMSGYRWVNLLNIFVQSTPMQMAFNLLQRNLWNTSIRCSSKNHWKQTRLRYPMVAKRWQYSDMTFNQRGKAYVDSFMWQESLHPLYRGFLRIGIHSNGRRTVLHWGLGSWELEVGGNFSIMWQYLLLQRWCLERGEEQSQKRVTMKTRALNSVQASYNLIAPCCLCLNHVRLRLPKPIPWPILSIFFMYMCISSNSLRLFSG